MASASAALASLFLLLRLLTVAVAQPLPLAPHQTSHHSQHASQSEDMDKTADSADVIIYLKGSAELSDLFHVSDESARRREVVTRLQNAANTTQPPVIQELNRLQAAGFVKSYQPFWIVNAIAVTLSTEVIPALQDLAGVDRIVSDNQFDAFGSPSNSESRWNEQASFGGWVSKPETRSGEAATWSIEMVRAPLVWNLLGDTGEGVTVAIVDTGVDWQHPALRRNYRGGNGADAQHAGNWFSPVQPTQTVPVDFHGHGTHVAGTAVGGQGIGVAPGANWIAVAIADENGRIRDSDIHAAFQWLLAPDGQPDLAPDVVNNSWGTNGDYTSYLDDVIALNAAGIVTVFAAGNTGPNGGTINAPASYPGTISVAAEDGAGSLTWFSSRGPSPLAAEPKPLITAPGAQILSAFPNSRYALFNGTSMAAPHVTGAVALMLAAEPRLTNADIMERLAAAAGNLVHDDGKGWGSLDAFSAVAPLTQIGSLAGSIQGPAGSIAGAAITITTPSRINIFLTADAHGRYSLPMKPGTYQIHSAAFGFESKDVETVEIIEGHVVGHNILLDPRPAGSLTVDLVDAVTGEALNGPILVKQEGKPVATAPELLPDGRSRWTLPVGKYELEARLPGYLLNKESVTVLAGGQHSLALPLETGPRLLIIDSGSWQFRSQAIYYEQALNDLGYFADTLAIDSPFGPLPTLDRLSAYDAVLWSAPYDSPGYISANDIITDYLGIGGRLVVAGQNVGSLDGSPGSLAIWWARNLEARWLAEASPESLLAGANGTHFKGLSLSLNGEDSARNQESPDQIMPLTGSLSQPLLLYPDGTAAALLASRCEPYRLIYLGFGLEGVTGRANRSALMQSILETLLSPEAREDGFWQPPQIEDFALGGDQPVYTLALRNLNRELTQTFHIESSGGDWQRNVLTPTLQIGPCGTANTMVSVNVPEGLGNDEHHTILVSAAVQGSAAGLEPTAFITIAHKTPGSILLVDDDRFQSAEQVYRRVMDRAGLQYDVWETGWQNDVRGSPRAEFLQAYDLVIWFTGYDWFQPVTPEENSALRSFLDGGGRLFLSSQDYLARNGDSPIAQEFLGVAGFQESITPTHVMFDEQAGYLPSIAGSVPLAYGVYQNFSDGLIPTAAATPFLWHNQGSAAAIATSGVGEAPWRSVFWAFPFETMPVELQDVAFQSILGQLSDIGDSRFVVDRRAGSADDPRGYTLTIVNGDDMRRRVWISSTLPVELNLLSEHIDFHYDRPQRLLSWEGVLEPGQRRVLRFTAAISGHVRRGARIDTTVFLRSTRVSTELNSGPLDNVILSRTATTWNETPDLSTSRLGVQSTILPPTNTGSHDRPVEIITYSLVMRNTEMIPTGQMSATVSLPRTLGALEDTMEATTGSLRLDAWRLVWQGKLSPGETVTATLALTQTVGIVPTYAAAAYLDDRVTDLLIRPVFHNPLPHIHFLPVLASGR